MYVVCKKHLNMAIDEFIDEYEQCPDVYELSKVTFTDWTPPEKCDFCEEQPEYLVV